MAWGRIDDGFDDHPKVLALLEEEQGIAAVGLWSLCFTWAHRNTRKKGKTPGLIPSGLPRRFGGPAARDLAKLLVAHRLWDEADDGWQIHDFGDYLPTEETKQARSEAGKRGAEKRWAGKRKADTSGEPEDSKQDDGNLPSGSHNDASNDVANDDSRAPARRAIPKGIAPSPSPEPGDEPSVHHEMSGDDVADDDEFEETDESEGEELREDVERVCQHLADRIVANGSPRPTVGKRWRTAARLLMDRDGKTEQQVHTAIDWCQDDEFWRGNVLSMSKLRQQYDQMRLQAEARRKRSRASPGGDQTQPPVPSRDEWKYRR